MEIPRLEIDPNVRISGNGTYVSLGSALSQGMPLTIGREVILFESEASIEGIGRIRSIDRDRKIVLLDVDWSSFRIVEA